MNEDRTRYPIADISAHGNASEAINHAISYLRALLSKPRFSIPKGESQLYLELRRDMPYIIHETKIQGTSIIVNRNYKPLGSNSRALENWVNYEAHVNGHVQLTDAEIASVVSPGHKRGLFGDENPPWRGRKEAQGYLVRLEKLQSIIRSKS